MAFALSRAGFSTKGTVVSKSEKRAKREHLLKRCRIAGVVMTFLLSTRSYGFDAWGFHTNMSLGEARSVAAQSGFPIVRDDRKQPPNTVSFYRSAADMEAGYGYQGTFCNGRLIGITQFTKGTMGALVDLLKDLKITYGRPIVDVSSEMLADGRFRWLRADFDPKADDKVFLIVLTTPGSDTNFRLSVSHGTTTGCARSMPP